MKKKNVAIVFGITDNYTDMLANVLIGLKRHSKKFWSDIIIYHEDVTEEHQNQINHILPCKFIKLSSEDFASYIPESQLEIYSVATFFRLKCFSLLDKYKSVIWEDVDILFQKDQSEILNYGNETGLALVKANNFRVENNFFELIPEYDMFVPMYNAGLIVLKDNLKDYQTMEKWCFECIKKYGSILRWCDQGVLNLLIQEYDIKVEEIDIYKWQCHPLEEDYIKDAAVIHAYGTRKFWNDKEYQELFPEWNENAKEWNQIRQNNSKNRPLVSVLMSTYNRYEFLPEAIESILNQTYQNFEIIVVLEYCENQNKIEKILLGYNDARIKIIKNKEKLGFSRSLNIGFDMAKGKYVARMDDDDISLPERLEKQVEFLELNNDIGALGTRAEFFMYSSGVFEYIPTDPEEVKVKMLSFSTICHPSIMMRKETFDKYALRYDPNYFTEDYELWSRAIKYMKIANLDEVLLMYRASFQNATAGQNEIKIHNSHKKIMKNQFSEYLNLELSDNELEVLQGRKNVIDNSIDKEGALLIRKKAIEKIISANKKTKFYNQETLEDFFEYKKIENVKSSKIRSKKISILHPIKVGIKKVIKPIYRPIYSSLERRIFGIVDNQKQQIVSSCCSMKNEIISKIDNKKVDLKFQNALLVNDTTDDYHCGSTITSFILRQKLRTKFNNIESVTIDEIRKIKMEVLTIDAFENIEIQNSYIKSCKNIFEKINRNDWIVINGEGCISIYNNDTCKLLFLIYLAKKRYNKKVAIINTSIYTNNYCQKLTSKEYYNYTSILKQVLSCADYCVVRDYISYMEANRLEASNVQLGFDSLPLYIEKYYNNVKSISNEQYIVISGGNFLPSNYVDIISNISNNYKNKIYYLYCNVENHPCTDELELYEKIKEKVGDKIELYETNDMNEFVSIIDNAKMLISGRFHHTITAFMTNTPFVTFKTNTKKVEAILSMIGYEERLVNKENYMEKIEKIMQADGKDNNTEMQKSICELAEINFRFDNKE